MDKEDENFFIKCDWNTYHEERELDKCVYCSAEDDNLNMLYWERRKESPYDVRLVAINPMPHEHINIRGGYMKDVELVCDVCLDEIKQNRIIFSLIQVKIFSNTGIKIKKIFEKSPFIDIFTIETLLLNQFYKKQKE